MSSSDRRSGTTGRAMRRGALAALGAVALLAGCTVHPVYMPVETATKDGLKSNVDLSAITVSAATTRVGQEVRNNLLFAFTGGKAAPPPRYVLNIDVANSEERLGFAKDETAPAYQVSVQVKYELRTIADDRLLGRSVSTGLATYNRSNQNFANVRARIDAENRAAESVADEIRLRIALAIAKDMPPAPMGTVKGPNLPAGATPSIISNSM